jgi:hypothetical protein
MNLMPRLLTQRMMPRLVTQRMMPRLLTQSMMPRLRRVGAELPQVMVGGRSLGLAQTVFELEDDGALDGLLGVLHY